jgi:nitrite reductase/ring-hydroxylating ferredoxin subunit
MKDCQDLTDRTSRREFLVKAAFLTGGLALTLSRSESVLGQPFEDITLTIDDKSTLNSVGGSAIVESSAGKIIVVRTGDATFVAYSARCPHKGGIVDYDVVKKEFVCPKHGSTFEVFSGAVINGPADDPLVSYPAAGSPKTVSVKVN